jgi:hypothetical protein
MTLDSAAISAMAGQMPGSLRNGKRVFMGVRVGVNDICTR